MTAQFSLDWKEGTFSTIELCRTSRAALIEFAAVVCNGKFQDSITFFQLYEEMEFQPFSDFSQKVNEPSCGRYAWFGESSSRSSVRLLQSIVTISRELTLLANMQIAAEIYEIIDSRWNRRPKVTHLIGNFRINLQKCTATSYLSELWRSQSKRDWITGNFRLAKIVTRYWSPRYAWCRAKHSMGVKNLCMALHVTWERSQLRQKIQISFL